MSEIKPSVTKELWLEKPDVAQHLMHSDSEAAASYNTAGWLVAGGMMATIIMNLAIRYGAGPFGGIIDLVMKTWKPRARDEDATQEQDHS